MGMIFLLPFFVVLDDGIESIVDSSLSCEESGRVLIWDFQLDSYVSVSCRFGLLDYYWKLVGVLDGRLLCALARELTLLGGLTHEFSSQRSHA